ncbi:MAG: GTP 3',8-cyclase MoaA [Rothia sp. (in: high G+C Gram-positive bacteria)]|nr:GTP 3',8-cyclase MoaA [Rothia sp. (in: high G+C Gram-positive bacteria)]
MAFSNEPFGGSHGASAGARSSTLIAGPTLAVVTEQKSTMPEELKKSGGLVDQWGRSASDLRISLTDKCNLRCQYCMPEQGLDWLAQQKLLSADEIVRLATIAVEHLGVHEIRFTGGEPLLRKELPQILHEIHEQHPQIPLSMTTNGLGLEKHADRLKSAGLERINISLDTICPETFAQLTRRDRLSDVFKGIDYAASIGLFPIKINAVLMPGINDDQGADLLEWALDNGYQLRFIEQMPLDADRKWSREGTITAQQIREQLSEKFLLHREPGPRGSAPADLWDVYPLGTSELSEHNKLGHVGIIASVTEPFCESCTRVRLTADGKIRSCLFSQTETDLRDLMRSGATDQEIAVRWREGMWEKPAAHGKNSAGFETEDFVRPARSMSAIGG